MMRRSRKVGCLLVLAGLVALSSGGCPPPFPIEREPVEISELGVILTASLPKDDAGIYQMFVGVVGNFRAQAFGGVGNYDYSHQSSTPGVVSSGEDERKSGFFSLTFSTPGTFDVTATVTNGPQMSADDKVTVRVLPAPPTPPPPPPPATVPLTLSFNTGGIVITGGALGADGSFTVSPGGTLWFNLTGAVTGGTPPYTYWLDDGSGAGFVRQSGPVFFWTIPASTVTRTVVLTVRIVDAVGTMISRTFVVVIYVPVIPPPVTPLVITSVSFSPTAQPFQVGKKTVITVNHTGRGTIHHLLATSSVVGNVIAEEDGQTSFDYIWPFPAEGNCYFWPGDRDSAPDLKMVWVEVE